MVRGNRGSLPPPPPPPPGLAEVLNAQTELLRQLVQGQQQQQQQHGHHAEPPQVASFTEFMGTHPPMFHKSEEPLDADAWIRAIESKFTLLTHPCSEENKARFAAQRLGGISLLWWENHVATLPEGHVVTWDEFKAAFRSHHIPEGVMERKLNEFLALTQGNRTVLQYSQLFNNLCQYAGYHANIDAKKRDRFRRGLSTKLKERLNLVRAESYNELVNMAITQEDCINAHRAEKKRKAPAGPSIIQPPRYQVVQRAAPKAPQRTPQQGRWVLRPPQQQGNARPPMPQPTGPRPTASQSLPPSVNNRCFNCGSSAHFA